MKKQLSGATQSSITSQGWQKLFEAYDDDGSGEIDLAEFRIAVRSDMGIPESIVTDEELRDLFAEADADGTGSLDAQEFSEWIVREPAPDDLPRFFEIKSIVQKASHETVTRMGWSKMFKSFDTNVRPCFGTWNHPVLGVVPCETRIDKGSRSTLIFVTG